MTKARDLANSADVFDTVSTTELGYLDGVTSAVQTQLDNKVDETGGSVISANSTGNALEIRQIGSGKALVVEDEANPDASPFVIDNAGRVAIGTSDAVSGYSLRVLGQAFIGTGTDLSPDASANGYVRFDGSGYDGFITLDGTAMYIGQNSGSRNLTIQTNEVDRLTVSGTGNVNVGSGTGGGTNTGGLSVAGKDLEIMQIMGAY